VSAAEASGREGGQEFRAAVAKWLRGAMRGPSGKDSPLVKDVARKSKVSRTTVWRIMNGQADTDEDTLLRLAAALKVPPPRVQRILRLDEPDSPFQMPPIAKLREAAALVLEAVAELDGVTPSVGAAKHAHRVVEKQVAPHHKSRPA
jgi:hypothetical protein